MKLAVAYVLWSMHRALTEAGIRDDDSARRVLGTTLFTAAKSLRITRLADALDSDAQSAEANPNHVHVLPPLRQIAVLDIVDGTGASEQSIESGSEMAQAIEIVKVRWRQFSVFENYKITGKQRRGIRNVFEHVEGVGGDIVTAARKKTSVKAVALAKKLRAAADALAAADPNLADAACRRAGSRQTDLTAFLTETADALESEAELQDRLQTWHGHVETRGGKNMQRAQVIDLLVPIFEDITGKIAHASWDPNLDQHNRETLFVRFVSDMCRKSGHEDWCRGMVDAVRTTLKLRKQGGRGKKSKA